MEIICQHLNACFALLVLSHAPPAVGCFECPALNPVRADNAQILQVAQNSHPCINLTMDGQRPSLTSAAHASGSKQEGVLYTEY